MARFTYVVLAVVALTSVDASCTDLGSCNEEVFDEPHEVSLLQTDLHIHQSAMNSPDAKKVSKKEESTENDGDGKKPAEKTDAPPAAPEQSAKKPAKISLTFATIWGIAALALIFLAGLLSYTAESGRHKYVSEFVGTFMLIFAVGCNVLVGDSTWGVTSIAMTLMVMIYALGGVSGGNFNPAVSISLGLAKKLQWTEVAVYVCVQLAAGIVAGLCYGLMLGDTFDLAPKDGFNWAQAGIAEMAYTFMLTFVVLNVAASKAHAGKNQFYGLAIGFTVIAGGYGAGSISGGCFNPAVALGIDASSSDTGFGACFVYWIFELIGCALAAVFFRICRPEDYEFDEDMSSSPGLGSRLVSEFLGTFMLVLTVGLNVLAKSKAGAFSIAAALTSMIFALGSVSGAHFNPAVTMAIAWSGRGLISMYDAALYMVVQVVAAVCAAFLFSAMMHGDTVTLEPKKGSAEALLGEFVFTFLLSFVVLSVATTRSPLSEFFGLAIGACVIAGGVAIGGLSGGSLNPAVSAGLAFSDFSLKGGPIQHFFSYALVELVAGVTAAGVFQVCHVNEYPQNLDEKEVA